MRKPAASRKNSSKPAFEQTASEIPLQKLLNRIDRADDLEQLRSLARELAVIGFTDRLTGLPNRHAFNAAAPAEMAKAERGARPLCYLLIDIDKFKTINDTHGHDVGDRVLVEAANVLRGSLRPGDSIFRMGGEEILVIAPGTRHEGARLAERLRHAVETHDFELPDRNVTISVGVARSKPAQEPGELFKSADQQTYAAKEAGRNQVKLSPLKP